MIEQYIPEMLGCSDGSCIFVKNTGMVTNGGCSCARELSRTDEGFKAVRIIQWLRGQINSQIKKQEKNQ